MDAILLVVNFGFAGASLFSTPLKCSVHLAFTSLLLLMRFPFLSRTVQLCLDLSLHSIFVSTYNVFICWLFAASSASSAMFYVHFLLSAFILPLTSLSVSVYFALKLFLTLRLSKILVNPPCPFPKTFRSPQEVPPPPSPCGIHNDCSLNVFKMFSFFSLVVSLLTLIPFFSFGWFVNLNRPFAVRGHVTSFL